jgi:hypothetical protein
MSGFTVDCSMYEELVKSDIPEVLNGNNRLDNLRYLVLAAVAPCDPQSVAKTRFSMADLQSVAENLRMHFDNTHTAPRILEEVLATAKFIEITKSEGKPRYYYSITEFGLKEVANKMKSLRSLAQVVDFEKKLILNKKKRLDRRDLPKNVVGLLGGSPSSEDLRAIKQHIIRDLELI